MKTKQVFMLFIILIYFSVSYAQSNVQMRVITMQQDTLLADKGREEGITQNAFFNIMRYYPEKMLKLGKTQVIASTDDYCQLLVIEIAQDSSVRSTDVLSEIINGELAVPDTLFGSFSSYIKAPYLSESKKTSRTNASASSQSSIQKLRPYGTPSTSLIIRSIELGAGMGTRTKVMNQQTGLNFFFQLDFITCQLRFNRLMGIGIESKIGEAAAALNLLGKSNFTIASLLPVYVNIPIGFTRMQYEQFGKRIVRSPYHYFFVGSNVLHQDYNYLHLGYCYRKSLTKYQTVFDPSLLFYSVYDWLADKLLKTTPVIDYSIKVGIHHVIDVGYGEFGYAKNHKYSYWGGYITLTIGSSSGY